MIVYLITNRVNGKQYVGKTVQKLSKRWGFHKYSAAHPLRHKSSLYQAMRKYGVPNFSIEVIDNSAQSLEELNGLESYYIQRLSTCNPEFGYNLTMGGDTAPSGERNHWFGIGPMKGKLHSDESKLLTSKALIGRAKSEQHRINAAMAKRKHWRHLPFAITCRNEGASFRIIGEKLGISHQTVKRLCNSQGVR